MFTPRSVYHDATVVELFTPYNAAFVERIKAEVPPSYRKWDPQAKTWMVAAPFDTIATRILVQMFPHAEVGDKPRGESLFGETATCRCDSDHRALYVCQNAPEPVIKAAYRALAKISHPDAGGDSEQMRAINAAYERLTSGGAT